MPVPDYEEGGGAGLPPHDPHDLLDVIKQGLEHGSASGSLPGKQASDDSAQGPQERSLERLLQIAHSMNQIRDREDLFESVSGWLGELFDAENSFVVLLDEQGQPELRSARMRVPGTDGFPISETILKRAIAAGQPIAIDDAVQEPDLSSRVSIERFHIRSVLCAPLVVGERTIGVLQFDHRSSSVRFPAGDRRLLQLFADQAATAFQNLELIEQLKDAASRVQDAHEKLIQSERLSALGEMASGMAHNFNNTLSIALGLGDVLLTRRDIPEDVHSMIADIRGCAKDAANTVHRLQEFSRGDTKSEGIQALCNPGAILTELVPIFATKLREVESEKAIRIQLRNVIQPTPHVLARPADLREVLINLIYNAIESMEESGEIELSSNCVGDQVTLNIRDEGCGMTPEVTGRVFEPFFSTKSNRGSGLGLSTSWSIVRRLGGSIDITSDPGKGSLFSLRLPMATDQPRPQPDAVPKENLEELRVLVIDDDPQVLRTMARLLEVLGHDAVEFVDPREGLDAFAGGEFDVVVTDLGMPGTDGTDVAREVYRTDPDVPVVIMTGWGYDAMARARAGEGVREVLAKPLTLDGIRAAFARSLGA